MARFNPFAVDLAGRRYTGDWELDGTDVVVRSAHGSRRAPLGRAKPETVAKRLLAQIVDAKAPRR